MRATHRFTLPRRLASSAAFACAFFSSACEAPGREPAPSAPRESSSRDSDPAAVAREAASRPWTKTFLQEGVLVAREVRIEGPPGLFEHVVVRPDPERHRHSVRTVAEGLLSETVVIEGYEDETIRAQLDQLTIAAEARLVVLERLGAARVTVEASGDAVLKSISGGEKRGEILRIVGEEDAR